MTRHLTSHQMQLNLVTPLQSVKPKTIPAEVRFRKMLKAKGKNCLEFTGAIDPSSIGYGRFRVDNVTTDLAHRFAYRMAHGTVPPLLRHVCHNPACCNPDHLVPGTAQQNYDDMKTARRDRSRLKVQQVELIVRLHSTRGMTINALSKQFKVSTFSLSKLLSGKTWSKVTGIQYQPKRPAKARLAA